MANEVISVRLQRNGPIVPWGFTLKQSGNQFVIAKVSSPFICIINTLFAQLDPNSMAQKAGIQVGDTLHELFGLPVGQISMDEAVRQIQHCNTIDMLLKRFSSYN